MTGQPKGTARHRRWARAVGALLLGLSLPTAALDQDSEFSDYLVEHWSVEDGLPQITVLSIAQDGDGYLWVGTQNGVARFDGQRFERFDRGNTGLDITMASSSLADSGGSVWFGTPRGLLEFRDGSFVERRAVQAQLSVRDVAEWPQGRVLASTAEGVLGVVGDGMLPAILEGEAVHALLARGDTLWAGGEGQLWQLTLHDVQRIELPQGRAAVTHLDVLDHQLAVGTEQGLWAYDSRNGAWRQPIPALADVAITVLRYDREGSLWAGSVERLERLLPDGRTEEVGALALSGQPWLNALFEDHSGDLWMGSQHESLLRVSNSAARRFGERDGLGDPFVWSVLADSDGSLLVGTNSGLQRMSAAGRLSEVLPTDSLPNPAVYNLYRDSSSRLWVGTRGGLALLQDGAAVTPPAFAALEALQINSIAEDGETFWIGSMDGLWRWDGIELRRVGPSSGSAQARIRSINVETAGQLLLATEGGVRRFRGGVFEPVPWAQPLEGTFVSRLAPVDAGRMLVTTLDAGLGLVHGDTLRLVSTEDGLPTRNGWSVDIVGRHAYVSSIGGVYRTLLDRLPWPDSGIDRIESEMVLRSVHRARGTQRLVCCNGGADARSAVRGGVLFYPSTNGVLRLDTDAVPPQSSAPTVVIERLQHAGRSLFPHGELRLEGESRDVQIDFTGVSLRASEQIEFRYRLAGYQDHWIHAGVRRTAFFTHLPPGRYRLDVEARQPSGAWTPAQRPLQFEIVPSFFEQRSVHAGAGVLLLGLGVVLWRRHVWRLRRRERELAAAVDERTHALARANDRLREANRALLQESRTDALTGVWNRRAALQALSEWPSYVLLLIDLDGFKGINDTHGHAVGDEVLRELAHILRSDRDGRTEVARWGGEEFLVICRQSPLHECQALAERLRGEVERTLFVGGRSGLRVTCSIGIAQHPVAPDHAHDWALALELADRALYRAKTGGRNRVQWIAQDEVLAELRAIGSRHVLPGEALDHRG